MGDGPNTVSMFWGLGQMFQGPRAQSSRDYIDLPCHQAEWREDADQQIACVSLQIQLGVPEQSIGQCETEPFKFVLIMTVESFES